jgi:Iap family predicted aminopeptidase
VIEDLPLNTGDIQSLPSEPQDLTEEKIDDIYIEADEINPNQIIYDLDNDQIIVPLSEDDIITQPTPTPLLVNKVVSRNVSNSRRRNFR